MNKFYLLNQDIRYRQVAIDVYDRYVNYNHECKEAYCPLCHRFVEGSVWEGPFSFYVRTLKLTDVLFPLAPVYMLVSDKFIDWFYQAGLTGIKSLKDCDIFYKKEKIKQKYYIPIFEYSGRAIPYAIQKNEERKSDKSLPRCSLCMNSNSEKDNLYFGSSKEFDVFKVYDRPGKIFCSEDFLKLCNAHQINNIDFRNVR